MSIVVDSHQHFWDPVAFALPNFLHEQQVLNRAYLPEHLKPELDRAGVSYVVAVQALPQNRENNFWLFDLAERTDFIAGVVAWADLTRPADLADVLDDLKAKPFFCGVRHIVEMEEDNWLIKKEVLASLKELAQRDIPYDMQVKPKHLCHVLRVVQEVPDLSVVIDHMAKPEISQQKIDGWAETITEIAQLPQVFCKVSGFITEADLNNWKTKDMEPFVRHVMDVFGPSRLMFGSDWPVCNLAGDYQKVWKSTNEILADLSQDDYRKVFGENAIRFYKLEVGVTSSGRSSF